MNSIKEISSTVIAIKGKARLSEFRINSLKESLKNKENIHNLECCEIYFISLNKKLSQDNLNKLNNILSCSPVFEYDSDFSFTVIPRLGTISPWSSKASEILNNCGMDFLERIERGFYYSFNSQYKFETKDIRELADQLADRMTQDVMLDLSDSENIFSTLSPREVFDIPMFEEGISAIEEANISLGLALNEDEILYLYENYLETNSFNLLIRTLISLSLELSIEANSSFCVLAKLKPSTIKSLIRGFSGFFV